MTVETPFYVALAVLVVLFVGLRFWLRYRGPQRRRLRRRRRHEDSAGSTSSSSASGSGLDCGAGLAATGGTFGGMGTSRTWADDAVGSDSCNSGGGDGGGGGD